MTSRCKSNVTLAQAPVVLSEPVPASREFHQESLVQAPPALEQARRESLAPRVPDLARRASRARLGLQVLPASREGRWGQVPSEALPTAWPA